jgi:hypothetical protein
VALEETTPLQEPVKMELLIQVVAVVEDFKITAIILQAAQVALES